MRLWFNTILSLVVILPSLQLVLLFFVLGLVCVPKCPPLSGTYKNCCEQAQRSGLVIWFTVELCKQVGSIEGSHAAMRGMRGRPLSSEAAGRAFFKQILL